MERVLAQSAHTGSAAVVNHRVYSAFGTLESQSNEAVECLFGYTGRPYDKLNKLQNNGHRWYEAGTGRWLSEDPLGFGGGDVNLSRYCGNSPTNYIDPSGLAGDNFILTIHGEARGNAGGDLAMEWAYGSGGFAVGCGDSQLWWLEFENGGGVSTGRTNPSLPRNPAPDPERDSVRIPGIEELRRECEQMTPEECEALRRWQEEQRRIPKFVRDDRTPEEIRNAELEAIGRDPSRSIDERAAAFRLRYPKSPLCEYYGPEGKAYDIFIAFTATGVAVARMGKTAPSSVVYDTGRVPGPNPNNLRQRVVTSPTAGEGGVYLKPQAGRTKIGSTGDFRGRYGPNAAYGIEVEVPQTRRGPPRGVDDTGHRWDAREQRRFDEEYIDRMTPKDVRYRDPRRPKSPVSQENWEQFRHIYGYGDLPSDFGY